MLKNYFLIAWRNLMKNKVYSAINIFGLAFGMTVALLIGLWVADEINFNKNFKNYDRVVRVMENSTHGNDISTFSSVPIPLSVELRTRYGSDFKKVAMGSWNFAHALAYSDKILSQKGMLAQPELLDILSVKMIRGTSATMRDPNSIIIDRSLAKAIFGNADPLNKILRIDNKGTVKVTGVYEDFPRNCDFRDTHFFQPWLYFAADQPWVKNSENNWDNNSFQIYAQLEDHADLQKTQARVKGGLTGHDRKDKPEVVLHPMSKWHLYNEFRNGRNTGGDIQFVRMFTIIAFFVLLLACINFMNLTTARSEKRSREVGIRKAMGSLRAQLVLQFLGESVLVTCLAFLLCLLFVQLSMPWFNRLADKEMSIFWTNPLFWLITGIAILVTGLVAGSYPAFYLSSFNSVKVLKGTFKAGRFASLPRRILVVLQFTVSVSLIIGTLIIFQQLQYARNRPIGYTREGLLTMMISTTDLVTHFEAIRTELLQSGSIAEMAESGSPTTGIWSNQSGFDWPGKDPGLNPTFAVIAVTTGFGKTVGWQFTDGRDFSKEYASDSAGMVLNDAAIKYMGLKKGVGETVKYLYSERKNKNFRVIGVIKDMVMNSPFEPVKPAIFLMDASATGINVITVKINPSMSTARALPNIEAVFKKFNPGAPFEYKFNDDEYAQKFATEQRIGSLASFFAIFAVFISCLGLFGLASFTVEQRTKEIGVRKVLGASVINIWSLISKDFLLLVFISFFIAIPASWYLMHNWLQQYDYRTPISAWIFFATGGAALLITLVTVSFQSIRASLANPVKSLRTE